MGRLLGCLSVFGLLILLFCLALGGLPLGTGQEIPVVANIRNAEPKILSVELLDEFEEGSDSIDPASTFFADIFVRDNNTLLDIEAIGGSFSLVSPQ